MPGTTLPTKAATPTKTFHGAKRMVVMQAPVKWVAIQYTNEQGELEAPIVCVVIGSEVYVPKDADVWSKELRPAKPWIKEQVLATNNAQEASAKQAPADAVDVLSEVSDAPTAG